MFNNKIKALGRMKKGKMNKTEEMYAEHLKLLQNKGDILWFCFEGIKFKIANNTTYTPDFVVMLSSGEIQIHEVKGYWLDDARVKIKVAAGMYPFQFISAKKSKNGFEYEYF